MVLRREWHNTRAEWATSLRHMLKGKLDMLAHTFSVNGLLNRVVHMSEAKPLGWSTLDRSNIGVNPGDLVVIAGRTGHGKSAVLINLMLHWLETAPSESFILFSYEIPPEGIFMRMLAAMTRKHNMTGWSYHDVRQWIQSDGQSFSDALDDSGMVWALDRLTEWEKRIEIVYRPEWTARDLAQHCADWCDRTHRPGGVFLDYLQLVAPPPGTYDTRAAENDAVARVLKRLAVSLNCPVVAAAQASHDAARANEWIPEGGLDDDRVLKAIAKRRPQLHHIREGGGEQEADLVLSLLNYRADFLAAYEQAGMGSSYDQQTGNSGPFEVAVIKNRHGPLGIAPLILEAQSGAIRDPGVFGK